MTTKPSRSPRYSVSDHLAAIQKITLALLQNLDSETLAQKKWSWDSRLERGLVDAERGLLDACETSGVHPH